MGLAVQRVGLAQGLEDFLRSVFRACSSVFRGVTQVFEHHHKLIPPLAGHRVVFMHAGAQAMRHLQQQRVATVVSLGLVQGFEVVQVQQQQGPAALVAGARGQGLLQAVGTVNLLAGGNVTLDADANAGAQGQSILFKPFSSAASDVKALVYTPEDLAVSNPVSAAISQDALPKFKVIDDILGKLIDLNGFEDCTLVPVGLHERTDLLPLHMRWPGDDPTATLVVEQKYQNFEQSTAYSVAFLLAVAAAHAFVNVRYLVTAIAATVMALLQPLLDRGFTQGTLQLWMVPLAILGVFFVRGVAQFVGQYALARIANEGMLTLRQSLFDRVLAAEMGLFSRQSASTLSNTVVYEVQTGATLLVQALLGVSRDGFTLVALLVYLLYLNWQLTLIVAVVVPSPATVDVLLATSLTIWAPMFS